MHEAIGTILVGVATVDEFERALAAIERGPLPSDGLARVAELQRRFLIEAADPRRVGK
jgi:hypothetical protein